MVGSLLQVPYSEVRHQQPDDCVHCESVAVRGEAMNWTIPAHRHLGLHQFQMLRSGQLSGTIDGREFEATGPALLMIAPGSVHGFTYSKESVGYQVTIPSATLRELIGSSQRVEGELEASFVISLGERLDDLFALFEQLAREFAGREVGRANALLSLVTLIAVQLMRQRGRQFEASKGHGMRDVLAQRFVALVEKHYLEQQPLKFYADLLAVTPDHLSRSCRQAFGKSALQVMHERLLLEARRLLAYTAMSVKVIAYQLQFTDAAYFSRFFAREMGHTPLEYRRQVAQGVRNADSKKLVNAI